MSQFDQRGQKVNIQHNAGRDINFGVVQNADDLLTTLERLKEEVAKAKTENVLDKKKAIDVECQIAKVVQEAEEAKPNKKTMLDYLSTAKVLIEGVTSASSLITALTGAIQAVQRLFP